MKELHYCQIYKDSFLKPRCKVQCTTCKEAKETIKATKKAKNKKRNKRYYLHSIIKEQGCSFNARNRTVFVPYTQTEYSKHVLRLRDEFGYSIQTEIV